MKALRLALLSLVASASFPFAAHADSVCGLVIAGPSTGVLSAAGAEWARTTLYWNVVQNKASDETYYNQDGYSEIDAALGSAPNTTMVSVETFAPFLNIRGQYGTACSPTDWQHVLDQWAAF